jgi:hypothetical protein
VRKRRKLVFFVIYSFFYCSFINPENTRRIGKMGVESVHQSIIVPFRFNDGRFDFLAGAAGGTVSTVVSFLGSFPGSFSALFSLLSTSDLLSAASLPHDFVDRFSGELFFDK